MNDTDLDILLDAMKKTVPSLSGGKSSADFCHALRSHARHRRFLERILAGASVVCVIAAVIGVSRMRTGQGTDARNAREEWTVAQNLFPESGIVFVNGELTTCQRQNQAVPAYCLKINLNDCVESNRMNCDFIVSDEDYVSFDVKGANGNFIVSRCSENEIIIDLSMEVSHGNLAGHTIDDTLVVRPGGKSVAVDSGTEGVSVELQLVPCV